MVSTADTKTELSSLLTKADLAFIYMMRTLTWELEAQGIPLPNDKITVVDVGSGTMLYGFALEVWAHQQAKEARLITVDPEYSLPERKDGFFPQRIQRISGSQSSIEQVASYVEEALPKLKAIGVEKIDLITLFNPRPFGPLLNVASLGELCRGVPVVGTVNCPIENSIDHLVQGLSEQGYRVITSPNYVSQHMCQSYLFEFNPKFVALPKSLT